MKEKRENFRWKEKYWIFVQTFWEMIGSYYFFNWSFIYSLFQVSIYYIYLSDCSLFLARIKHQYGVIFEHFFQNQSNYRILWFDPNCFCFLFHWSMFIDNNLLGAALNKVEALNAALVDHSKIFLKIVLCVDEQINYNQNVIIKKKRKLKKITFFQ